MKITQISPANLKKGLSAYGIKALVRKYQGITISVWVEASDIEKTAKFFESMNIKRLYNGTIVKPIQVNGGEFNSLVLIPE